MQFNVHTPEAPRHSNDDIFDVPITLSHHIHFNYPSYSGRRIQGMHIVLNYNNFTEILLFSRRRRGEKKGVENIKKNLQLTPLETSIRQKYFAIQPSHRIVIFVCLLKIYVHICDCYGNIVHIHIACGIVFINVNSELANNAHTRRGEKAHT